MQSNRPNLFIIGAMKSGTSSLHAHLNRHPRVFMSTPKEPCRFIDAAQLRQSWPQMWERGYCNSEAAYLGLFADAGDCAVIGESSTDYSKLPVFGGVVERIAEFNPEARFVYIMRDPVRRTLSHYWHMVEHRSERRGLLDALHSEPAYRQVSHYAMQLQPYITTFGRERVYTLTFEQYLADPAVALAGLLDWLDLEPMPASSEHRAERRNMTSETVLQARGSGLLNRFRHSACWSAMEGWVPAPLRRVGRSLAQRPVRRSDAIGEQQAIDWLRPVQQTETDALRQLLGRDFPEWTTLYAQDSSKKVQA